MLEVVVTCSDMGGVERREEGWREGREGVRKGEAR
jgi:hypothetical protein